MMRIYETSYNEKSTTCARRLLKKAVVGLPSLETVMAVRGGRSAQADKEARQHIQAPPAKGQTSLETGM